MGIDQRNDPFAPGLPPGRPRSARLAKSALRVLSLVARARGVRTPNPQTRNTHSQPRNTQDLRMQAVMGAISRLWVRTHNPEISTPEPRNPNSGTRNPNPPNPVWGSAPVELPSGPFSPEAGPSRTRSSPLPGCSRNSKRNLEPDISGTRRHSRKHCRVGTKPLNPHPATRRPETRDSIGR